MSDIFEIYALYEGLPEFYGLYVAHELLDATAPSAIDVRTKPAVDTIPDLADAEDYLGIERLKFLDTSQLDGGRLRRHQAEGIGKMAQTAKTLCADPVGAGKTVQAAGTIAYLVQIGEVTLDRPALWLTDGNTLAEQTARELQRFLPDLVIRNLAGLREMDHRSGERRRRAVAEPAHIKIMTFSQWSVRDHLWEEALPVVVLDEVSALKGGGERHAAVERATAQAGRVHGFTATLYENNPVEVWQIYSLLHIPNLPSKREFNEKFVEWRYFENHNAPYAWASREAAARFGELTAAYYFRREDATRHLRRPEHVRHPDIWVPLSAAQSQGMRRVDRESWGLQRLQRQEAIITGKDMPSTRALRASGLINEIVAADPTAKVLLVGEHLRELDAIAVELDRFGIGHVQLRGQTKQADRPGVVETFRTEPNVSVMLGSKVVERGLNLQFCRYLISVGLPDNPARLDQAIGRVVRHGSPFPQVHHWVILNDHEYDRRAVERLARKEEQAALLRAQTG